MTTWTRSLGQYNGYLNIALLLVLAILLVLSPAEVTLGNTVKVVYAHGAAQRVAVYAYIAAGIVGLAQLGLNRGALARWTQALLETALLLWWAQIIISVPAQILAWGGFTLNEPRVASALWIAALTTFIYLVARWVGDPSWVALGAAASVAVLLVVLQGAINILHPLNAIASSDSLSIKVSYAAIVAATGALAFQFARYRAAGAR